MRTLALCRWTISSSRITKGISRPTFRSLFAKLHIASNLSSRVTRNLLLGQLREWGIKISEGQLNNILIKAKDNYHAEKRNIFEAGCLNASYLQADDTGNRHRGKNGYCTYIGNDQVSSLDISYAVDYFLN